jgi:hypothetical protein
VDGSRLPVFDLELLSAPREGDFAKIARVTRRRVAPGERIVEETPLPEPGTTLRFAARARADGRASRLTTPVALTTMAEVPAPSALEVRSDPAGVRVSWTAPELRARIDGLGPPPPQGAVDTQEPGEAAVRPVPSTMAGASAEGSPGAVPPAPETPPAAPEVPPASTPAPEASPGAVPASPLPVAVPSWTGPGFFVYRRAKAGDYDRPLETEPVAAGPITDATVTPGEEWCYEVRTVLSMTPLVESEPCDEACLAFEDVAAPATPAGVAARGVEGGVEISWSPSDESDLALHRVYRWSEGQPVAPIADVPAPETTYLDREAPEGVVARYSVTAVDGVGNESKRSPGVSASRP